MRRALTAVTTALLVSLSVSARADEVEMETIEYGGDVALLYGGCYVAAGAGLALTRTTPTGPRAVGFVLVSGGMLTALLGVAATHFNYDNAVSAYATFGGQIGGLAVGGIVGGAISGDSDGVVFGAATGHVVWAVVDTLVMSDVDRMVSMTGPAASLVPVDGGALGVVGGTF